MNGAALGSKYLVEAGKTLQTVTCSFCGTSCSRHGSITPPPLSASPRCFQYHSRIESRLADLKKTPPIPRMRPRCSILTGAFDFSGCRDCTSCPPFERAEMSNSEPSAIVLHGNPCIGGLYISFDSNGGNGSLVVMGGPLKLGFGLSGAVLLLDRVFPPLFRVFVRLFRLDLDPSLTDGCVVAKTAPL